jgi:DNA polymerase-3 subunit alpha
MIRRLRTAESAETTAVFQLESRGMKELIARLRRTASRTSSHWWRSVRPGPLQSGMVDNFIDRKHGREEVSYPDPDYQHALLQPVLEPTYGIILYQEQVMQIAQVLAGYTLGGADLLRRAMGKKKPEEMAKQRSVFAAGAAEQGIDAGLATKIFDLVEKFAGYGFNKSHSAAYALVSYQTAWLKAHYPAAFMAAVMSSELDNTDKIVVLIEECRRMGLTVRLPDVNEGATCLRSARGRDRLRPGRDQGPGRGPVESLLASRESRAVFRDLFEFCARTDPRKLNRKALEALVRSGAFDSLGTERWVLFAAIDDALRAAEQNAANRDAGMVDLFGETVQASREVDDPYAELRGVRPWTDRERLQGERDTLGLYVTGHPIDACEDELRRFAPQRLADLRTDSRGNCRVAGLIMSMRSMKSARGAMAVFVLDDRSAARGHRLLRGVSAVPGSAGQGPDRHRRGSSGPGRSQRRDGDARVGAAQSRGRALATGLGTDDRCAGGAGRRSIPGVSAHRAGCSAGGVPGAAALPPARQSASLMLGDSWRVQPSEELLEELRRELGRDKVSSRLIDRKHREACNENLTSTSHQENQNESASPTTTEIEAAVFRRLLAHLDAHKEVQNIELMNLAGFCRNCLSKWYVAAAAEQGEQVDYDAARERVYGMPYAEWKARTRARLLPEQLAAICQTANTAVVRSSTTIIRRTR